MQLAVDSKGSPCFEGTLCNAMLGNLLVIGVCQYSADGDIVLHDIFHDIEFVVETLPEFYCFTGIDMCSLPENVIHIYLKYVNLI